MSIFRKNSNTYKVCVLASSNLLLQILGFIYRMMLTELAGTEALGLQSLVMQVYSIAAAICISGMNVAVTAMSASISSCGGSIRRLTRCALRIYIILYIMMAAPVFLLRGAIAKSMIGDASLTGSLVLVLICIFMTGIENLLKSVHLGTGRIRKTAVSELMEQSVRFLLVFLLLSKRGSVESSEKVFMIMLGMVFSEFVSVGFLLTSYIRSFGNERTVALPNIAHEYAALLIPASFTALASTVFASTAALLLPGRLELAGYAREQALSAIGMLNSVAAPLVMLPMSLVGAVGSVALPEISAAFCEGDGEKLKRLTNRGMLAALSAALCINFAFLPILQHLAYSLFGIAPRNAIFVLLSLKTGIIYFQVVTAAVLNGMKRQRSVLIYAVIGESIQLVLIYLLSAVRELHIYGYLISMSIGEGVRLILSLSEIKRVMGESPLNMRDCLPPVFAGMTAFLYSRYIAGTYKVTDSSPLPLLCRALVIFVLGMCGAYLASTAKRSLRKTQKRNE